MCEAPKTIKTTNTTQKHDARNCRNNTHTHQTPQRIQIRAGIRCSQPLYNSQPPHQQPTHTKPKQPGTRRCSNWHNIQKPDSMLDTHNPQKAMTTTTTSTQPAMTHIAWFSPKQPQKTLHPLRHNTGLHKILRKEVIQPHLPVRLPCYDFVPIANPTFEHSPHQKAVRPCASGVANFRDVTGGVYKARERIHRSVADLRLLATPTSWGRVADPNPN